jgi:hypothetical protein
VNDTPRAGSGDAEGVSDQTSGAERMLELLVARSHELRSSDIPDLVEEAAAYLGAASALVYLVDHEQRWLIPFGPKGAPRGETLNIDGTLAGRAFRSGRLVAGEDTGPGDDATQVWVPLIDGADRMGVLSLGLDRPDERTLRRCGVLATLLAELITNRSRHGDTIPLLRRNREMTLAAELRWSQLPPLTTVTGEVALSGILEPAYEIAGDAFDFAVNTHDTHLGIFDAMGHGLEASVMASLAVSAYRHGRRTGLGLSELYRVIDEAVATIFGGERFVTGQFAHLDCITGEMLWLSAGHPQPLLLRNNRAVGELRCEPALPLGLGGSPGQVSETSLEPGDRVLFYSDGVVEARSPAGELFGIDRLTDLLERAAASGQPLPETLRRLVHSVLDHQSDRLQDDATVLLLEWRGPESGDGPDLDHLEGPD